MGIGGEGSTRQSESRETERTWHRLAWFIERQGREQGGKKTNRWQKLHNVGVNVRNSVPRWKQKRSGSSGGGGEGETEQVEIDKRMRMQRQRTSRMQRQQRQWRHGSTDGGLHRMSEKEQCETPKGRANRRGSTEKMERESLSVLKLKLTAVSPICCLHIRIAKLCSSNYTSLHI